MDITGWRIGTVRRTLPSHESVAHCAVTQGLLRRLQAARAGEYRARSLLYPARSAR